MWRTLIPSTHTPYGRVVGSIRGVRNYSITKYSNHRLHIRSLQDLFFLSWLGLHTNDHHWIIINTYLERKDNQLTYPWKWTCYCYTATQVLAYVQGFAKSQILISQHYGCFPSQGQILPVDWYDSRMMSKFKCDTEIFWLWLTPNLPLNPSLSSVFPLYHVTVGVGSPATMASNFTDWPKRKKKIVVILIANWWSGCKFGDFTDFPSSHDAIWWNTLSVKRN